ncbi:DNA cross-link repair protein SNM1 [Ziziphus jujuba]|uniref:DNA cross-link repair protein SNM1 n=1 Tax=Ziziphus jujuba TaxID=326968 RepID=A0A6P4AFA6_ZIZJJ|nr:DNA cross-link repair protein SNM1 [Ziziphus jujuba]
MSFEDDDDDDFQIPFSQTISSTPRVVCSSSQKKPLQTSNLNHRLSKKPKPSIPNYVGKENAFSLPLQNNLSKNQDSKSSLDVRECFKFSDAAADCSLDSLQSSFDCPSLAVADENVNECTVNCSGYVEKKGLLNKNGGYYLNSIESRLMGSRGDCRFDVVGKDGSSDAGSEGELDALLNLCSALEEESEDYLIGEKSGDLVQCPLCGVDISDLSEEQRQLHTNDCLDKGEAQAQVVVQHEEEGPQVSGQVVDVSPVVEWLRGLGLAKYGDAFVREEIDWDTLQWLKEEDLFSIGITALGPRKKIVHALSQLRNASFKAIEAHTEAQVSEPARNVVETPSDVLEGTVDDASKAAPNKLITDYFRGSASERKKPCTNSREPHVVTKKSSGSGRKQAAVKSCVTNGKYRNPPLWCCIPGTPFRVDAFRYLRGDCSHWFLTHFHMDHYQGLTRSFCHGKIYCSSITAKLVNMKIGIPWDRLQVLPLSEKINIAGIGVTCLDANHCPGSIILLFEPPNGKAVLHTGDFRFSEDAGFMSVLQSFAVHTLILDTTYCNPQYDFPKKEAAIQFVIDAIQAESFNPKTLFLIGSYTIGKEQLFLEVARVLRKKVYVTAAKLRILKCLELPQEDMQWLTLNEQESHIHVVPLWTLASFKRIKHISNQYMGRFSLIVAFSPTGWSFGKGMKKSPGRKWQQGTIIRYEVPYSEHSSFTELKQFVKLLSPVNIIPSVNNNGQDSAKSMVSLLLS